MANTFPLLRTAIARCPTPDRGANLPHRPLPAHAGKPVAQPAIRDACRIAAGRPKSRPGRLNWLERLWPAVAVAATTLALFSGCASPKDDLSSIDDLSPQQRLWVTEIKKYIDPKALRVWLETAQVGKDGYTIPRTAWPSWLSHPGGGLPPPFEVARIPRTDPPSVFYILDFGPGQVESGIKVNQLNAPIGPHAGSTYIEWEKGIYFFFSRGRSSPRLPWMDEELELPQ